MAGRSHCGVQMSGAPGATVLATDPPKPPASKPTPGWKHLKKLLPYIARSKGQVAVGMVTLAAMGIVGTLQPLAFGVIMDCLSGNAQPLGRLSQMSPRLVHFLIPAYAPSSVRALIIYCIAAVAIVALKGVFSFWTRWILIGLSRDIEFDLRNDLLDRLLLMEPEFYVRNRTGELMSRATNDLNNVRMVLGPGIMYTGQTLVTMILAVIIMARLSPSLTLWVLLPVPIVAAAVRHFGKVIHDLNETIQASLATLPAKVQENLSGVRVIRAYAQEEAEIRGFDEPNREYVARNIKLIRTWSMFMPSLQALIGVSFLIVLWQGGHQLLRGQISLGALIAFYSYLGLLVWPMIALGWVTNIFQRGAASTGRLHYILRATPQIDDRAAKVPPETPIAGEIEFRNLTFTYPTNLAGNGANPSKTNSAGMPAGSSPSAAKTNGAAHAVL